MPASPQTMPPTKVVELSHSSDVGGSCTSQGAQGSDFWKPGLKAALRINKETGNAAQKASLGKANAAIQERSAKRRAAYDLKPRLCAQCNAPLDYRWALKGAKRCRHHGLERHVMATIEQSRAILALEDRSATIELEECDRTYFRDYKQLDVDPKRIQLAHFNAQEVSELAVAWRRRALLLKAWYVTIKKPWIVVNKIAYQLNSFHVDADGKQFAVLWDSLDGFYRAPSAAIESAALAGKVTTRIEARKVAKKLREKTKPVEGPPKPDNFAEAVAFAKHIASLSKYLDEESQNSQARHISYSKSGGHYQFLTHMLLKARNGNLPIDHFQRLTELNFTFGQDARTFKELVYPSTSSKAAGDPTHVWYQDVLAFNHWAATKMQNKQSLVVIREELVPMQFLSVGGQKYDEEFVVFSYLSRGSRCGVGISGSLVKPIMQALNRHGKYIGTDCDGEYFSLRLTGVKKQ